MKTLDWLTSSTKILESSGIATARLDCLVLLSDVLGVDKAVVLSNPDRPLSQSTVSKLNKQLVQRSKHQPLAYIRGRTEFYGRCFAINKDVLEPRPESETMIDILVSLNNPEVIIDIGTGSGALAITAKLELPGSKVVAIDIDPKCLTVTRNNARTLDVDIDIIQSNLLESLDSSLADNSVLLANLPYVPDSFNLNKAAMNEPRLAIFGGSDGLDIYRQLFEQIKSINARPKQILCESLPSQHHKLKILARNFSYELTREDDFIQLYSLTD